MIEGFPVVRDAVVVTCGRLEQAGIDAAPGFPDPLTLPAVRVALVGSQIFGRMQTSYVEVEAVAVGREAAMGLVERCVAAMVRMPWHVDGVWPLATELDEAPATLPWDGGNAEARAHATIALTLTHMP